MKKKTRERVEKLKKILQKKIGGFAENHTTFMFCYPFGIKYSSKKGLKSISYQQHIYICKHLCQKQCESFVRKVYLCRNIGCSYYPICESKSVSIRKEFCKDKNLLKERKELNKVYNKYLYLMSVRRGLQMDPLKTLKYLDTKKKKEQNGKISNSKNRKKSKKVRKRKTTKD